MEGVCCLTLLSPYHLYVFTADFSCQKGKSPLKTPNPKNTFISQQQHENVIFLGSSTTYMTKITLYFSHPSRQPHSSRLLQYICTNSTETEGEL